MFHAAEVGGIFFPMCRSLYFAMPAAALILAGSAQATEQTSNGTANAEQFKPLDDPNIAQTMWGFSRVQQTFTAGCRIVVQPVEQIDEGRKHGYGVLISVGDGPQFSTFSQVWLPEQDVPPFRKLLNYVETLNGSATKAPAWQYRVDGYGFTIVEYGEKDTEDLNPTVTIGAKGKPGYQNCTLAEISKMNEALGEAMEKLSALK